MTPVRGHDRLPDVTDLHDDVIADQCTLLYDLGCMHGLRDDQRAGWARGVARVAATGATLLVFAFAPVRARPFRAESVARRSRICSGSTGRWST